MQRVLVSNPQYGTRTRGLAEGLGMTLRVVHNGVIFLPQLTWLTVVDIPIGGLNFITAQGEWLTCFVSTLWLGWGLPY